MRQRFGIIAAILLVVGFLIALNSLTYRRAEEPVDTELNPNRSTYNAGPTGARAFFELLKESGYSVMRWREIPERLLGATGERVETFIIIASTRVPFDEDEAKSLLLWVERGGTLVVVDRQPEVTLLKSGAHWTVTTEFNFQFPGIDAAADDPIAGVTPLRPSQPTLFTREVDQVMPSRFATTIRFTPAQLESSIGMAVEGEAQYEEERPPSQVAGEPDEDAEYASPAPVQHVVAANGALLVDWVLGTGRIILLSDPYILSNSGINKEDNLQLSLNLVGGRGEGLIAFDEYHHGKGVNQNALISYFKGTPILAITGQLVFLLLLIMFTNARRFARPLPLREVDRRSNLEFVASMAELQHRARAFDLAIENIYGRSRRALARHAGLEYNSARSEIATRVALRSSLDPQQLESLMRECEQAINGDPISSKRSLQLVRQLRELENTLGLRRGGVKSSWTSDRS